MGGMQVSFNHANPAASHDSTLLQISPRDEDPYWYLIDAGESVSPAAFTGPDSSLDRVCTITRTTRESKTTSTISDQSVRV